MERVVAVLMHPRESVWDALCERTCELAPYLEHIESAELKSRVTTLKARSLRARLACATKRTGDSRAPH
jgi:hypothetical protein